MKAAENTKTARGKLLISALAAVALSSACASTFTVPSGATDTQTGLTETDRTIKDGDGTLVVNGSSSLKTVTVKAGTLSFSGGTAIINDSTATAANGNGLFWQSGGSTVIKDGATVTASGGTYVMVNNGSFTVTNATFDASGIGGDFMNAFSGTGTSDCWINIESNGVLKTTRLRPTGGAATSSIKESVGVRLNRGGELHLKCFWIDGGNNNRYGRVLFDGGQVYVTAPSGWPLFNASSDKYLVANGYEQNQITPTILAGGCYIRTIGNTYVYPAFSGIPGGGKDGGLHHSGSGVLYWRTGYWRPSTYNGGTWLESNDGATFSLNGDSNGDDALGVVPATPSTNIWFTGNNHSLFNEGTVNIHTNRMIFIKNDRRMYVGSSGRLAIHGEIHGEITAGNTMPLGTILHVKNGGSWNGIVSLDPGAGHTNDVGRIVNYGHLEVTSGVTRVVTSSSSTDAGLALVFVSGTNSNQLAFNSNFGHLIVNGGTLMTVPQDSGNRFLIAKAYAHTEIMNGGKIDMPKACYVNGLSSPAKLTIADGGELKVGEFQFANSTANCVVNLNNGGRLVSNAFWCNSEGGAECAVNIDGGVIGSQGDQEVNFGLGNGGVNRWTGVNIFVKEGGVTFDVPSNNLWVRLPLQSAAAEDAGFRKTGAGVLVVMTNLVYKGSTTVSEGQVQFRYHNALPQTTLKLENGGIAAFSKYDSSSWENYTHTEQTFKRIEGYGRLNYSKNVHVTESIAPSADGWIYFEWACDLNGDLEIEANANGMVIGGITNGCGRIAWPRFTMDLSKLTLKVKDFSKFDPEKAKRDPSTGTGYYRIVECPANLYTGKLNLPPDWPSNWAVVYAPNGAYLKYLKGTTVIVR